MNKAKMIGYQSPYIPNSKADRRYRAKSHLRQKERADNARDRRAESRMKREMEELEVMKRGIS